ncbi:hypothetical protein A7P23_27740 [Achromobacter xylosoxidans]|nr:hypothetical protein A7P23_27740 [Achromobacter xylosoxidans]
MTNQNQNNAAQAAMQRPIDEAIVILTEEAAALRECHTPSGDRDDWTGESEAKGAHDNMLRVAALLSKLRAPVADERDNWQQYRLRGSDETAQQIIERERDAYARLLKSVLAKPKASAPVAGEAQPSDADITNTISALEDQARHARHADGEMGVRVQDVMIARAVLARYGHAPMPMADAAPQASAENVRNAALEEAYEAVACLYAAHYQHGDLSALAALKEAGDDIRALKQHQAAQGQQ